MADTLHHSWEAVEGGGCTRMRVPTGWIYEIRSYDEKGHVIGHSHVFVPCEPMEYLKRMFPDGQQQQGT